MDARGLLIAAGGKVTEGNIHHFRELQFGQYQGQGFRWVLENAVGWAVGFLKSYGREGRSNISTLGVNKSLFHNYCMANPVIAQAVDFSVRVEAASKLVEDTGDDGHRLLEFGSYCDMSWCQLYESDEVDHVHFVRNYILPKSDCRKGTKMDMFCQYCLRRQSWPSTHPGSSAAMQESTGQKSAVCTDMSTFTHFCSCLTLMTIVMLCRSGTLLV